MRLPPLVALAVVLSGCAGSDAPARDVPSSFALSPSPVLAAWLNLTGEEDARGEGVRAVLEAMVSRDVADLRLGLAGTSALQTAGDPAATGPMRAGETRRMAVTLRASEDGTWRLHAWADAHGAPGTASGWSPLPATRHLVTRDVVLTVHGSDVGWSAPTGRDPGTPSFRVELQASTRAGGDVEVLVDVEASTDAPGSVLALAWTDGLRLVDGDPSTPVALTEGTTRLTFLFHADAPGEHQIQASLEPDPAVSTVPSVQDAVTVDTS